MADNIHGYPPDMWMRELNVSRSGSSFSDETPQGISQRRLGRLHSVANYYNTLSLSGYDTVDGESADCLALRLCRVLLTEIKTRRPLRGRDCFLSESFYRHCAGVVLRADIGKEIGDAEILVIHLKQLINILRAGSVLRVEGGRVAVAVEEEPSDNLYRHLLTTLWNHVPWERIFPSAPKTARKMQRNRFVMRDILLRGKRGVPVEHVANEFFCLTGVADENDLFHISFLDFYLFSWLRNFDIIRYLPSRGSEPVTIMTTERGRRILSYLG